MILMDIEQQLIDIEQHRSQ